MSCAKLTYPTAQQPVCPSERAPRLFQAKAINDWSPIAGSPILSRSKYLLRAHGFSGADLQALLYNANLDAIHESISNQPEMSSRSTKLDQIPLQYVVLDDPSGDITKTRADKMVFERKVNLNSPTKLL